MTVAGALGIQITSFVALLSVAGLAISLSLQNVLSSASCGVMLLSVKPFKVGDYVEIGGVGGTVREIGFMHTEARRARQQDNLRAEQRSLNLKDNQLHAGGQTPRRLRPSPPTTPARRRT